MCPPPKTGRASGRRSSGITGHTPPDYTPSPSAALEADDADRDEYTKMLIRQELEPRIEEVNAHLTAQIDELIK